MNVTSIKYLLRRFLFLFRSRSGFAEFHAIYAPKRTLNDLDVVKLKAGCERLESLGFNYRLTDGIALGFYREGGFIKHDDDVDVDVLNPDKALIKALKKSFGMRVGREVYYNNRIQQLAFYEPCGFIFDIVFWYSKDGNVYNYCEKGFERCQELRYFEIQQEDFYRFEGKLYPMPAFIEDWLVMRYGSDWMVPKLYKGDWKEECFDLVAIK